MQISQKLKIAEEWLTNEAKRYGKDVSFTNGYFGSDKTIIVDAIPIATGSGSESVDIVYETMQLIGWKNPMKFEDWVTDNTDCDQALVLIFANGKGRGYAMGYVEGYVKTHLEGAILFKSYLDGRDLYLSSIAHEMLHLFGAWDLYETFIKTSENSEKAEKSYPNDIMHKIKHNITSKTLVK